MHEKGYLQNILFLDIETVSLTKTFSDLPERLQKEWERKSTYINKDDLSIDELFNSRAAIFSEFGKIIVIGMGFLYYDKNKEVKYRLTSIANNDEKELLIEFNNVLSKFKKDNIVLCAHNGKEFDFPYLSRRMLINDVGLPEVLKLSGKKPWEVNHLDTMEMWKFGDRKRYTSLELLTACLNIPSSKSELDGSMVTNEYYRENNLKDIQAYCEHDVFNVMQVYLKLNGQNTLKKNGNN